jgi:hypothetical protein
MFNRGFVDYERLSEDVHVRHRMFRLTKPEILTGLAFLLTPVVVVLWLFFVLWLFPIELFPR